MNQNTTESLIKFIDAVETLTAGVVLHIGVATASEVLTACNELKHAIKKDETLNFPS